MSQTSFCDLAMRDAVLDQSNQFLLDLNQAVSWEIFRADLDTVWRGPASRSGPGRRPWDSVVMFKVLLLCELFHLSDDQVEDQMKDRLSFRYFLEFAMGERVPDSKTVWAYRNELVKAGALKGLFARFECQLAASGFAARGGQMVDATLVPAPRQHNTREEDRQIKEGETPDWETNKRRQKDTDANYTKKNGVWGFGYKNHVNVDAGNKLIRSYEVTPASTADVAMLAAVLLPAVLSTDVYADRAYYSQEIEALLASGGHNSRIMRRGTRHKLLGEEEKARNKELSRVRVRVEHVFGSIRNELGGNQVRCIGIARAAVRVGLKNLAYNMRRFITLLHLQRQPA